MALNVLMMQLTALCSERPLSDRIISRDYFYLLFYSLCHSKSNAHINGKDSDLANVEAIITCLLICK